VHRVIPVRRAYKGLPVQVLPGHRAKQARKVYRVPLAQQDHRAHKVCKV
jgi:hypothetical protein